MRDVMRFGPARKHMSDRGCGVPPQHSGGTPEPRQILICRSVVLPAASLDKASEWLVPWLGEWATNLGGYGSVDLFVAVLLMVFAAIFLPRANRSKIRGPL